MKKGTLITTCLGVCLLASSSLAAVVNVKSGDNLEAKLTGAKDGDIVKIEAGHYKISKIVTSGDITVLGIPYENTGNRADISEVVIECTNLKADAWITQGKTTLRGLRFEGGDHQIVAENEITVEYCVFDKGVDQISFNKPGYGTVRYCELYRSGDDGIDMDSNANVDGAFFDIHHNLIEASREDGIEFRTYGRKNPKSVMPVEFHHNTFFNCGTDLEAEGGDVIQIIDQEEDGAATREVLIYNNIMDGNNQSWNGVACNVKNSDAQHGSVGGSKLNEPIWVWNNTIVNLKGTAVAGGNHTWAFNNAIKDCNKGAFVRCEAENNVIENSSPLFGTAAKDKGGNVEQAINIDKATFEPQLDSPLIDTGLTSYTAGGLTITPEHDDIGALEGKVVPPPRCGFRSNLLDKGSVLIGTPFISTIANDAFSRDGDPLTFSKVAGPAWLIVSADGTLSGTPDVAGEQKFFVNAECADGVDTAELIVNVLDNEPIVIPPIQDVTVIAVSGTASVRLSAADAMGPITDYIWMEDGQIITSGPQTDHDFTVGVHVVTLVVNDIYGNTASTEFTVTVLPEIIPPLDAGPDIIVETFEGTPATVTLSATPDTHLNYVWKKEGVRVGEGATITLELSGGVHTFVVRTKDAEGNVERDDVVVTVVEIPKPKPMNIIKKSVILSTKAKVGKELKKDLSKKLNKNIRDSITFSKVDGPAWLKVAADGKVSGTPKAADKGNNTFVIQVTDNEGGSDTAKIKIKVK